MFGPSVGTKLARNHEKIFDDAASTDGLTAAELQNRNAGQDEDPAELLVALCRHSDEVLDTVLRLAGRTLHVRALQIALAQRTARDLCVILEAIDEQ